MISTCTVPVMDAAERIRALRRRLGLTQEQLGAQGGLRRTEITRLESGANQATSYETRKALSRCFGLSIEELAAYLDGESTVDAAYSSIQRRLASDTADADADPLPERASAVAFARAAGYPAEVIEMAYRARKGVRLSHDQWIDRLRGWRAEYEAGTLGQGGEAATEADFPKPRRS